MGSHKQIIIPGILSILILSSLFFFARSFYNEQYEITKKEILGIEKISVINTISSMVKHNRFISIVEPDLKADLENNASIPNTTILLELKKTANQEFINKVSILLEEEDNLLNGIDEKEYAQILKLLDDEKFHLSDNLSLFLEPQRDISFLISVYIRMIPQAIKNIESLRSIGLNALHPDSKQEYDKFVLDNNMNQFLSHLEEISKILNKIDGVQPEQLRKDLETIMLDVRSLEMIILNIQQDINEQTSIDYFVKVSNIHSLMNDFYFNMEKVILVKLQKRKDNLEFKLFLFTVLYLFLVVLLFIVMYVNLNKLTRAKEREKEINEYISTLKDTLLKADSVKNVCEISICQLVEKFGAIGGSVYLYNNENYKLLIGATYGIDSINFDKILDINNNTLGDSILENRYKFTKVDLDMKHGNKIVAIKEMLTIPLVNFAKPIGAIELYFEDSFNHDDLDFLNSVVKIMSENIYELKQKNDTKHYLKLIDENILVLKADIEGNIIDISEELCNLSGYARDELIGKNYVIFRHEDTPMVVHQEIMDNIKHGIVWKGELKNRTKNNDMFWSYNIFIPTFDINENIIGYTVVKHDITNKKLVEELSITDSMTGLYNKKYFDEVLDKQLLIAQREGKKLALAIIEIDYFKEYNDAYGDQTGDIVIKGVAATVNSHLSRPSDYCFRMDEYRFAMLYFYEIESSVIEYSNRVKKSVEHLKIVHDENKASDYVTISMGLKFIKGVELKDSKTALQKAYEALESAKSSGKNMVVAL